MLRFVIFCVTVIFGTVHANGDFIVLHSPSSVKFQGDEQVDQSLLKEVFTAALGFTIKQRGTWNGISLEGPFSLPEAVVGIAVEGVSSLEPTEGKRFPLNVDEVEETTWQALSGRLEERDSDNTLVRIYLGDGVDALGQSALGELKPTAIDESALQALSLNVEEDRKFLEEIGLLQAIANKIPSAIRADGKPDVYWLVVSGLKPVLDLHGKNSAAAKEALYLLKDTINEVSKAFMDVYNSKVLITAFTNDASQVRHTRSVPLERARRETAEGKDDKNIENKDAGENKEPESKTDNDNENYDSKSESNPLKNEDVREQQKEYSSTESIDVTSDDTLINEESNDKGSGSENVIKNEDVREQRKEFSSTEGNPVESDENLVSEEGIDKKDSTTSSAENVVFKKGGLNLSKNYSENYPVIFNILLWFGVAFFFSLLAICIAIADMDPGRDSIIYRMTSNRMKKDN